MFFSEYSRFRLGLKLVCLILMKVLIVLVVIRFLWLCSLIWCSYVVFFGLMLCSFGVFILVFWWICGWWFLVWFDCWCWSGWFLGCWYWICWLVYCCVVVVLLVLNVRLNCRWCGWGRYWCCLCVGLFVGWWWYCIYFCLVGCVCRLVGFGMG